MASDRTDNAVHYKRIWEPRVIMTDRANSTGRTETSDTDRSDVRGGELENALRDVRSFTEVWSRRSVAGAVALDGDYSLGPRSTEDGVQADVSKIELVLLLRREAGC